MTHHSPTPNAPKAPKIPITWLMLFVFLGILYSLLQPWANARLGLKLPSIAQIMAPDKPSPAQTPQSATEPIESREIDASTEQSSRGSVARDASPRSDAKPSSTEANPSPYQLLKNIGSEVYLSEAGLRYTRGSEEGHRLEHLARHLKDMPERSGSHGVFEGGWSVVLQRIDEAYRRSRSKEPGTKVRQEERRSVIETEFSESIGFVGGRDGARKGKPSTRRLRLVTEGDRFITAFPF